MLHPLRHPLAAHLVASLRDQATPPAEFRGLAHRLGLLLAMESTRDLPTQAATVATPLEDAAALRLAQPLVVVPILRAGLGLVQPFIDLFPDVSIGYIGLERDHTTAVAHSYYCKLPPLAGRTVVLVDPMLATGGSAAQALTLLKSHGATSLRMVCVVSAPEGVATLHAAHPEVPVFTAAHDRCLNDRKYILPGLGDFGDRLYGT
jgi:uracil phosphoribosyltransferase